MTNVGDICLINATKGGFYSKAIRFFTGGQWTHSATGFFFDRDRNVERILEANLLVQVSDASPTFDNPDILYRVYRIVNVNAEAMAAAVEELYDQSNGEMYGVFGIPWHIYRRGAELLGFDMRRARNFFPGGKICSQLVFKILERYTVYAQDGVLAAALGNYRSGSVSPADLEELCESLRKQMKIALVASR